MLRTSDYITKQVLITKVLEWIRCGNFVKRMFHHYGLRTQQDLFYSYNAAKKIKEKQDGYCRRALAHDWRNLGEFPEVFKWESLVDVLRGRAKVCLNFSSQSQMLDFYCTQVNVHCYEAVDLDAFVRVSKSVICGVSLSNDSLSYRTNSNSLLLHSTMLAKHIWSLIC